MNIDFKSLLLAHRGRIGRQDFWVGVAILWVAGMVLGLVPVLGQLVALVAIWPWYCLLSQRLHDTGRSGRLAAIAIVPAAGVTIFYGDSGTAELLILTQVVLSLQLSFAVFPLVMFTGDKAKMGELRSPLWLSAFAWLIAVVIAALNVKLLVDFMG